MTTERSTRVRRAGIAVAMGVAVIAAAARPAQAAPPYLDPSGSVTGAFDSESTLWAISCPTTTACTVVSGMGVFLETSDGGATWAAKSVPVSSGTVTSGSAYGTYYAVSCPAAHVCYASGAGYIAETTDGQAWSVQAPDPSSYHSLYGIHCLSTTTCLVVGYGNVVTRTTDGGQHWTLSRQLAAGQYLAAVDCPTALLCTAVGDAGSVTTSDNGGQSWMPRELPKPVPFYGVSCPDGIRCIAVGSGGAVAATADGGQHWAMQQSGTASDLYAIRCWDVHTCHAVGDTGTIIATTDGGATWVTQTSAFAAVAYPGAVCNTGYPPPVQGQSVCVAEPVTPPVAGIDCTGSQTCIAVGVDETMQTTTDGGATWSAAAPTPAPAGVDEAPSTQRTRDSTVPQNVAVRVPRHAGRAVTRHHDTTSVAPAPPMTAPVGHLDGVALRLAGTSHRDSTGTGVAVALVLVGICLGAGRRRSWRLLRG